MAGKCWDKRVDHAPCGMAPQPLGLPVIRPLSAAPDAACVEHNGPRPGAAQDKPEKREREREREGKGNFGASRNEDDEFRTETGCLGQDEPQHATSIYWLRPPPSTAFGNKSTKDQV